MCNALLLLKNRTDLLRPTSRPGSNCPDRRIVNKKCKTSQLGNGVDRGE
jgi:hypothetical protein